MAGLKLLTNLEPAMCLKLAWRTAQDAGYAVTTIDGGATRFTASKGSSLLSAFTGLVAPYCRFEISVESYPDATELVLVKNKAWLTGGASGMQAIERGAAGLVDGIAGAIAAAGGAVSGRKEF